jgi:hypothetical protein
MVIRRAGRRSGRRGPVAAGRESHRPGDFARARPVTAVGRKHLADRGSATEPGKPFPVRLLNRTEVIDKESAEFLLSLA